MAEHRFTTRVSAAILVSVVLVGCTSTGTLGFVSKPGADPGSVLIHPHSYRELGPAEGRACRYFLLAIIPFGNSAFSTAVDNALRGSGGDALLNVTTTSSLYGFVPIYNVFSFTCTTVRGTAIELEQSHSKGFD
jgi:hypothetical protein